MIRRQAECPDLAREPQPAEVLHRSRLGGVRLWIECGAWFLIHEKAANPPAAKFIRQHQPAGPSAGNQNFGVKGRAAGHR
jgi:hypothetical protein